MINTLFSKSFSLGTEESASYIYSKGLWMHGSQHFQQNSPGYQQILLVLPSSMQAKWSKSKLLMCVHMCMGHASVAMPELCHLNINTETHIEAWCTSCKDVDAKNGAAWPIDVFTERNVELKYAPVLLCKYIEKICYFEKKKFPGSAS